MTSWTAGVEWHEDLREDGHVRPMALEAQDWGTFRADSATGTMTAVVTIEAPNLLRALDAVLRLVGGHAGQDVTLNRIAATDEYWYDDADFHGRSEDIRATSRRTGHSRT
jgi:hypothetical protein